MAKQQARLNREMLALRKDIVFLGICLGFFLLSCIG